MEIVEHLKFPLEGIKLATSNFSEENFIASGGFGKVYKGKLVTSGEQKPVAIKRLDRKHGQGDREFLTEIQMLSCYKHKNLISLVGFCKESSENILVYEYAKHGSLDKHLANDKLSWLQRLTISLGAARGFYYLHNDVGPQHRVLHRDIKSSNILLDENWEAKISDFGLSKIGPSNVEFTFLATNACGTIGYVDPQYVKTGILTKESDVYSFGVVLFEILCGRPAIINTHQDDCRFLASLAQRSLEQNILDEIIFPGIKNEMKAESLKVFTMVAYQCLKKKRNERPTMAWIVERLEKALELQANSKVAGFIRVGIWGRQRQSGGPQNNWSFELESDHRLQKITIDHGDDGIYSLMFTTKCEDIFQTSNKVGGWAGGQTVSEVTFEINEEIVGIKGSVGTRGGYTIISLLSFKTNERTHGPFGGTSDAHNEFTIPWDKGSLVGFYGIAGDYIDGIGVYVKAHEEIMRIGTWGRSDAGEPRNVWSFKLERNHRLKKITVDHGDLIYSLMFTTQYRGLTHDYNKIGGWNGGDKVSKVTFDWNEEIIAISGTVAISEGDFPGHTIISSLSFVTNRKTHGPFGTIRGSPFMVPWNDGLFYGFYGLCGFYLDSIGVYLKEAARWDI
ncbi:hypothetical protein R6Q59_007474 [Mikania micrantha]